MAAWRRTARSCSVDGCVSDDYYAKGLCRAHYNQQYHQKNRTQVRRRQRQYYVDNVERERTRCLANFYADRERALRNNRAYYLRTKFGLTVERYAEMFDAQEGVCAICHEPESVPGRSLAVDHCHSTGCVRALLCGRCNLMLGKIGDNPAIALRMAQYLAEHSAIGEVAG